MFTDINIPVEYYRDVLRRQAVVNKGITFRFRNQVGGKFETEEFCYADASASISRSWWGTTPLPCPSTGKPSAGAGRGKPAGDEAEDHGLLLLLQADQPYRVLSQLLLAGIRRKPDKAVRSGFTAAFDKYLRDNNKYTKNENKIIFQDIQDSLVLVTNCFSTIGCFENQTKKSVNSKFTQDAMTAFFKEQLQVWFIENKQEPIRRRSRFW